MGMFGNFVSGLGQGISNVGAGIGNAFTSMGNWGQNANVSNQLNSTFANNPNLFGTGMGGVNAAGGGMGTGGFNTMSNWGSLAGGLAQGYMAYKQMGLAEDQFDFQKGAFNANLQNQDEWNRKTARDNHNAAIGSTTPGRLMPTSEYMDEIDTVSRVG